MDNGFYYTNEEKLKCVIKHLSLENKNIANTFGISEGQASKLTNPDEGRLKTMHLHAFAHAYDVPMNIFTDKNIDTKNKIIDILEQDLELNKKSIFLKNNDLFKSIVGDWYAYFHPSNAFASIYCIKTTIHEDYTVTDENKNYGELLIGERQSIIVKKARNSKNFVSISFDNHQVAYKIFPFTMTSKTNQVNREMCNFGFYSREKIDLDIAEKILGTEISRVQLKMDCDFKERVAAYGFIVENK